MNIVDEIKNPINNLTDPEKYNDWLNTVTESITPQEKVEENITPETNQEINQEINQEEKKEIKEETKEYKYTKEEVRKKMQDVLKEVDNQYSNTDSYIGTSCFGDCINGVINVNFSENIGRYDFTVKSHSAMLSNKIIEAIPGYFNQLRIRFIYKGQAVCSCTFTEYQTNIMIPKGCTYLGYKE